MKDRADADRPEPRAAPASRRCRSRREPEPELRRHLPPFARGMKIGLFGGSFNPPHAAHRAASLLALKRLGLNRVWWLVTPGNPLKDLRDLDPLEVRLCAARRLARDPRIEVTAIEAISRTRYTFETVRWLQHRCPGVHFVWLMGADNLANFHRWQHWRALAARLPIAVIDRAGAARALASPAAHRLAAVRIPESRARRLPLAAPPAFTFLHGLKSALSSSSLRHPSG